LIANHRTSSFSSVAPAWLAASGLPLAAAAVGVVAAIQTVLAIQFGLHPEQVPNDFTYFYQAAQAIRTGGDWYGGPPNLNPPGVAILFAPFAMVSFPVAYLTWTVLILAALAAVSMRIAGALKGPRAFWLVILMLATITGMMNVAMGQLGFLMAWLVTVAWLADRERRPVVAGLAIGVAVYAKVFLGVFLVYLLWRRAWRTLGFTIVGFTFMALVGFAAGGWDVHRAWLGTLSGIRWLPNPLNASMTGIVERTLHGEGRWIIVLLEGGVLAVLALGIAKHDDTDRSWALLLFGSLLLSPLGWMYYIPMALGPVVALWYRGGMRTRWLIVGGVLLLCVHPPESGSVFYSLTRGSVYAWAVVLFLLAALYAPKPIEAPERSDPERHRSPILPGEPTLAEERSS
jgi:hypothetical protein